MVVFGGHSLIYSHLCLEHKASEILMKQKIIMILNSTYQLSYPLQVLPSPHLVYLTKLRLTVEMACCYIQIDFIFELEKEQKKCDGSGFEAT